jgi:hypothetical protein
VEGLAGLKVVEPEQEGLVVAEMAAAISEQARLGQ